MNKIFTLIFFVITFCSFCQDKFEEGHIVKSNGDTLKVYLRNDGFDKNFNLISFVNERGQPIEKLTCNSVQSFWLQEQNRLFLTKSITYNLYSKEIRSGESLIRETLRDTIFCEVLFKDASIVLYSIYDKYNQQRFFIENEDSMEELIYYSYILIKEEKRYQLVNKAYINQLKGILKPCKEIDFSNLDYDKRSFLKLFEAYSRCNSDKVEISIKKEKPTGHLSVGGGAIAFFSEDQFGKSLSGGLQVRFPGHSYNRYIMAQIQRVWNFPNNNGHFSDGYLVSFLVGGYFGNRNIRPYLHGGIATGKTNETVIIPILTAGVSYKKKIHLETTLLIWYSLRYSF
ncbi:MAG TPA: hypothetical protein VD908_00870 [Cytophagales bacterium]|nr:hypothetical protein [Cytophagales bacterium]